MACRAFFITALLPPEFFIIHCSYLWFTIYLRLMVLTFVMSRVIAPEGLIDCKCSQQPFHQNDFYSMLRRGLFSSFFPTQLLQVAARLSLSLFEKSNSESSFSSEQTWHLLLIGGGLVRCHS